MSEQGFKVTKNFVRKTAEGLRRLSKSSGTGFDNRALPGFDWIWARINGRTRIPNTNLFTYGWIEQRRTKNGWEDMPSGRNVTSASADASVNIHHHALRGVCVPDYEIVKMYPDQYFDTSSGEWVSQWAFERTFSDDMYVSITRADAPNDGTDGNSNTAPSYRYKQPTDIVTGHEILQIDGTSYSPIQTTTVIPTVLRQLGSFDPATIGVVRFFDISSTTNYKLALIQVFERERVC